MKKISVVIPVYNAEKYLEECFESVIGQTYKDFEVVVINDGSTDGSQEIIDRYVSDYPEIFCCHYQKNQGQSSARNKGLLHTQGEYIAFVDADDYILPDYLEKLFTVAVEKKSELVICSYKKFLNDGTIVLVRDAREWEISFGKFSHVFSYSPCAKLIKKSILIEHNIFFSEGEKMEDGPYSIMTNCIAKNVEVMEYFGYMYRMYDDSTMGAVRKKGISVSDSSLKLPVHGLETAIQKVLSAGQQEEGYYQMIEYVALKAVAGYIYVFSKRETSRNLRTICEYAERIIRTYFPNVCRNPYIRIRKPKGLPLTHRVAVWILKVTYRLHIMYPFALVYTGVYKNK